MEREQGIRISQCMIVKNEEKNIRQALSWGRDMMWEQIVVDTGSTDRTVEIAEEMGARVCFFTWVDDFSAAKNYAIEQAQGDWIAFLDADEYMMPDGVEKITSMLQQVSEQGYDGISTGWQHLNDEGGIVASGTQVRFFRNHPDIRYWRRIHENLVVCSGRALRLKDLVQDVSIFHTGYQTEAMAGKKKSKRNRNLILQELKDHPDSYEMMGYMGDDCMGQGETEEAKEWYRKSIRSMPDALDPSDQRSAVTLNGLMAILWVELRERGKSMSKEKRRDLQEEIHGIYQKAVTLLPEEADFDYTMGCNFAAANQAREGMEYLERAIQKLEKYGCADKANVLAAHLLSAYDLLVRCSYEVGEREKCAAYAVQYLKYSKYEMGVLVHLVQVLVPEGDSGMEQYPGILNFFAKLYDLSALKDQLFLIKAVEAMERKAFTVYMKDCFFTKEQQEQLRSAKVL